VTDLPTIDRPIEIVPGAVPDSLIPNFRCRKHAPNKRVMFLGGPADGKFISVPPDGRHYYYRPDPDNDESTVFIYYPAVIRLKTGVTAVYILDSHIERQEAELTKIENSMKEIGQQQPKCIGQQRLLT
jgi:hypothetical protein